MSRYGGGGKASHVKTYGDVPQFWVIFLQEIPKHGSDFQNFVCCGKIAGDGYLFFRKKSVNMGIHFWKKSPLNMGMGLELQAAHPQPIQIWVPLPGHVISSQDIYIDLSWPAVSLWLGGLYTRIKYQVDKYTKANHLLPWQPIKHFPPWWLPVT